MVQNAKLYFSLCETPAWLTLAYTLSRVNSRVKEWLVKKVLWIQLRAVFRENDILEYRGAVRILRWYYVFDQPTWLIRSKSGVCKLLQMDISGGIGGWLGMCLA